MTCKIILISNTAWSIANFRTGLIRGLLTAGHTVVAVAPPDKHISRITDLGVRFVPMEMDNKGTNPLKDFNLFLRFVQLFRKEMPCIFLGFTVKPNVYGGLAAAVCRIPAINNVAGLGTVFVRDSLLTWLVAKLYRLGLAKSRKVFFQNKDDLSLFLKSGLVSIGVTGLLPGSGVNTEWFKPAFINDDLSSSLIQSTAIQSNKDGVFRFLLSARLLWDKGVKEFVDSAKILHSAGTNTKFQLLGFLDAENRTSIPRDTVNDWEDEGIIQYLGESVDVRPILAQADCIVLPSYYREGTPRSLIEAASMAKPIITTDTPGCRDVVIDGFNGYLCKPRDAADLADKMLKMINLTPYERNVMGCNGRMLVLREFDEQIVINRYLKAIKDIIESDSLMPAKIHHH